MKKNIFHLGLLSLFFISFLIGFSCFYYFYRPVPKIIHYVWIGDKEMPERARKAIESWKKYAPDYVIKRHDETNCDINANPYVREAYGMGQYRYVSDWCRFTALYNEGGIYFDVDHYLNGSVDDLRETNLSFSFEDKNALSISGIAAAKSNQLIKNIIDFYQSKEHFDEISGPLLLTPLIFDFYPSLRRTGRFQRLGKQITLWPANYYMIDFGGSENKATHRYHAWAADSSKFGDYYYIVSEIFLNELAYHLQNGSSSDYLIPIKNDIYYKLNSKDRYKLRVLDNKCFEIKSILYKDNETYCPDNENIYLLQKE